MTCSVLRLQDLSMVTGIEITGDAPDDIDGEYEACLKRKTTWNVIPKKSDVENPRRLHRIYSDVCGPFCKGTSLDCLDNLVGFASASVPTDPQSLWS